MRRFVLLSVSLVLTLGACAEHKLAPVTIYGESAGMGSGGVHVVQRGENIHSISQRYHIVMNDLAFANGLKAPYMIKPGQRLRLPPPPTYRVRRGDSLSAVAQIFGVPTEKMIAVNGIGKPYTIKPGQVLKLPRVSAEEASKGYKSVKLASARKPGVKSSQQDIVVHESVSKAEKKQTKKKASAGAAKSAVKTAPPKRSSSKFMRPVEGDIISNYGAKEGGLHNDGMNIRAPRGAPVKAADNGVVVYAGSELKGSGNLVLVRHSDRWMTAYAHMDKITVNRGDVLTRGQQLGTVGSTGSVDSPQLHFEVRKGTTAINPKKYM